MVVVVVGVVVIVDGGGCGRGGSHCGGGHCGSGSGAGSCMFVHIEIQINIQMKKKNSMQRQRINAVGDWQCVTDMRNRGKVQKSLIPKHKRQKNISSISNLTDGKTHCSINEICALFA